VGPRRERHLGLGPVASNGPRRGGRFICNRSARPWVVRLDGNDVCTHVGARRGISSITVRRRARKAITALVEAHAGYDNAETRERSSCRRGGGSSVGPVLSPAWRWRWRSPTT
jgi:hypothetical protein